MTQTIADLYLPGADVTEVVLGIGGKIKFASMWQYEIDKIASTLKKNDPLPSYRNMRKEGNRLVLECEEIDYATNLAMLKKFIPGDGITPLCVIGVPKIAENGIVVGELGETFSSGMTQGIPAGAVTIFNPTVKSPLLSFYKELAEETGLSGQDVDDVKFLGMVYERRNGQMAITYGYNTRMGLIDFSRRMEKAPDHKEYTTTNPIPNKILAIYRFVRTSENTTGHCKGAVALHGLAEFPDSPRIRSLIGENRQFDYFN